MVYGPESHNFATLSKASFFGIRQGELVYRNTFKVHQKFLDREIKDSKGLDDVKCYFSDEVKHLQLNNGYTQNNCLLKCKLDLVTKICDCLPWFVEYEGNEFKICGLFGNKCYEQLMLRVNKFVDTRDPKHPPCGCFPNCQDTRYQLHLKQEENNMLEGQEEKNLIDIKNYIQVFPGRLLSSYIFFLSRTNKIPCC
jgi:hypothetical protein